MDTKNDTRNIAPPIPEAEKQPLRVVTNCASCWQVLTIGKSAFVLFGGVVMTACASFEMWTKRLSANQNNTFRAQRTKKTKQKKRQTDRKIQTETDRQRTRGEERGREEGSGVARRRKREEERERRERAVQNYLGRWDWPSRWRWRLSWRTDRTPTRGRRAACPSRTAWSWTAARRRLQGHTTPARGQWRWRFPSFITCTMHSPSKFISTKTLKSWSSGTHLGTKRVGAKCLSAWGHPLAHSWTTGHFCTTLNLHTRAKSDAISVKAAAISPSEYVSILHRGTTNCWNQSCFFAASLSATKMKNRLSGLFLSALWLRFMFANTALKQMQHVFALNPVQTSVSRHRCQSEWQNIQLTMLFVNKTSDKECQPCVSYDDQ